MWERDYRAKMCVGNFLGVMSVRRQTLDTRLSWRHLSYAGRKYDLVYGKLLGGVKKGSSNEVL